MRNKIHIEENSYKFIGANNSNQDIDNDGNDDPLAYKNKYGIWLIGYDGKVKAFSKNRSLLVKIHKIIDKMPLSKKFIHELKVAEKYKHLPYKQYRKKVSEELKRPWLVKGEKD